MFAGFSSTQKTLLWRLPLTFRILSFNHPHKIFLSAIHGQAFQQYDAIETKYYVYIDSEDDLSIRLLLRLDTAERREVLALAGYHPTIHLFL